MLSHSNNIIKGFIIGSFKYRKITSFLLIFSYLVYLGFFFFSFNQFSDTLFKGLPVSLFFGVLVALFGLSNMLKNLIINVLVSLVNTYFFFILFSSFLILTME